MRLPFIGLIMQKFIIWSRVSVSSAILIYLGNGFELSSVPFGWQDEHDRPLLPSVESTQSRSPVAATLALLVMRHFLIGVLAEASLMLQGFTTPQGFFTLQGLALHGLSRISATALGTVATVKSKAAVMISASESVMAALLDRVRVKVRISSSFFKNKN
jgi:hypothetical protein